jgi:DNA-binding protein Fis
MALYGRQRDIKLFRSFNNEIIKDIVQTEIGYYVLNLSSTKTNIYNESLAKQYDPPVLVPCLINKADQTSAADAFGIDRNQTIDFRFQKQILKDQKVYPQIGDIILFVNNYFEVDELVENQYILGKNPDYSYNTDVDDFGDSFSIILKSHMMRRGALNIENTRNG